MEGFQAYGNFATSSIRKGISTYVARLAADSRNAVRPTCTKAALSLQGQPSTAQNATGSMANYSCEATSMAVDVTCYNKIFYGGNEAVGLTPLNGVAMNVAGSSAYAVHAYPSIIMYLFNRGIYTYNKDRRFLPKSITSLYSMYNVFTK